MMEHPLPEHFQKQIVQLFGSEEAAQLCRCLDEAPETSIRISQAKAHLFNPDALPIDGVVPWCPWGRYLSSRPVFTGSAGLHGGVYYVQEASSMVLYQISRMLPSEPIVMLDLCAAPGGKSSLLLDLLPKDSILVSNEIVRQRAQVLAENLLKWGSPNQIVTSASPDQMGQLAAAFDFILVDAPCSGEGMFRKDLAARSEWSADSPRACAKRQRKILSDIWPALKPGGLMIYSTCTINQEENEDILAYLIDDLGAEAVDLGDLPAGVWHSPLSPYPCYRLLPHRLRGEGLFMGLVRKAEGGTSPKAPRQGSLRKSKVGTMDKRIPALVKDWIIQPEYFLWELRLEMLQAYPMPMLAILDRIRHGRIPIVTAGVPVALLRGRDFIPAPALALSSVLQRDAFDWVELHSSELVPYLSRETITLEAGLSPGVKLMHHDGIPLGFLKHLGNRANNWYPAEWRIRHASKLTGELL